MSRQSLSRYPTIHAEAHIANANAIADLLWTYPPARCTCTPGYQCKAHPRGEIAKKPHKAITDDRQYTDDAESNWPEETRDDVRDAIQRWIDDKGRPPYVREFYLIGKKDPVWSALARNTVFRLYKNAAELWEDCYEHGICTYEQFRAAMSRSHSENKYRNKYNT